MSRSVKQKRDKGQRKNFRYRHLGKINSKWRDKIAFNILVINKAKNWEMSCSRNQTIFVATLFFNQKFMKLCSFDR